MREGEAKCPKCGTDLKGCIRRSWAAGSRGPGKSGDIMAEADCPECGFSGHTFVLEESRV